MGSCQACAAPIEPGDRFCSACGHALGEPESGGDVSDDSWAAGSALDEPELIIVAPRAASRPPPARPGRRRPPPWMGLTAAAAVLVVALAVWAISRAGRDQADSADGAEPAITPTTPTIADIEPSSETSGGVEPASTSTLGTAPITDPDAGGSGDPEASGPVLGHATGWSLFVGSSFSGVLSRLDLDTGQLKRFGGVEGSPVTTIDGRLVLAHWGEVSRVALRIVPMDQLTADGIEIEVSDGALMSPWPVTADDGGHLWVYHIIGGTASWRLVRPEDGEQLDEVRLGPGLEAVPVADAGPDVVGAGGGGVYRRDGDAYRLVGPGSPAAVSGGDVLIWDCSAPAVCPMRWLDVETGVAVERPVPPQEAGTLWRGVSAPTGRFVFGLRPAEDDRFTQDVVVRDLESGSTTVLSGGTFDSGIFASSPDGRYLAVGAGGHLHLYDVELDRWIELDRMIDQGATLLFVSNGEAP